MGPDGSASQGTALLDSVSSTSFIMERLAQHLHLVRRNHSIKISGFSETSNQPSSRGATNFSITHPDHKGKIVPVEALILYHSLSVQYIQNVMYHSRLCRMEHATDRTTYIQ